jgi:hypothetical protein
MVRPSPAPCPTVVGSGACAGTLLPCPLVPQTATQIVVAGHPLHQRRSQQGWRSWGGRCRRPDVIVAIPECHCARCKVPHNGLERLKPLYAKNHLVGAEREAIAVDHEWLGADPYGQVRAAAGARQAIPIGYNHAYDSSTAKLDSRTLDQLSVNEVKLCVEPETSSAVNLASFTMT